jgi:fibrillarin-like rRNA methylase
MKFTLEKIVKVMDKIFHEQNETKILKSNYDFFIKGVYSVLISIKESEFDIDTDINTTDLLLTIPEDWEDYFKIIDPEYEEYIRLKKKFEN